MIELERVGLIVAEWRVEGHALTVDVYCGVGQRERCGGARALLDGLDVLSARTRRAQLKYLGRCHAWWMERR